MEKKATFDRETDVNLSLEQLSYICKYCGKVNSISAPNCIRCGKRRPRNEYLDAMKRLDESKTVREEFISEQIKAEAELKDARQQQFVRMVESRVADEKARITAQQEVILDQDREDIKKATARDAVLRIIAAENAAEERVAAAERRADDAIKGRSKEIDDLIAAEREKALNAAAEKLIAERAAIEEVAKERVEANRKAVEFDAAKQIEEAKEEAQKTAARQAVLQIIAAEKAAEDQIRISRDAFQQAATERIVEERILADKEAAARYAAEKQAIERAAEERIRAEREAVKKILDERGVMMGGYAQAMAPYPAPAAQQVQPFAVVPYLNQNQPVYQYNPNRVVFKFVPDAPAQETRSTVEKLPYVADPGMESPLPDVGEGRKRKEKKVKIKGEKSTKTRVFGILTLVMTAIIIAICAVVDLVKADFTMLNVTDGAVLTGGNSSVIVACGGFVMDGINALFKTTIAVPAFFAEGDFYISAGSLGFGAVGLVSVAMLVLAITTIIVFIRSIVRIVSGRGGKYDWVAGVVMIAAVVVASLCEFLSLMLGAQLELAEALKTTFITNFGNIALLVLAVVTTIFAGIGGKQKK